MEKTIDIRSIPMPPKIRYIRQEHSDELGKIYDYWTYLSITCALVLLGHSFALMNLSLQLIFKGVNTDWVDYVLWSGFIMSAIVAGVGIYLNRRFNKLCEN